MQNIQTEILINATPQQVWKTLLDFENYPNWNPFIHIKGQAKVGQQLTNTLFLDNQKPQVFKPIVLAIEKQQQLRWQGQLFIKGLFDGEHYFKLEAVSQNQTKLIHGENFSGILTSLILKMVKTATINGFEKMNTALKRQVENVLVEVE